MFWKKFGDRTRVAVVIATLTLIFSLLGIFVNPYILGAFVLFAVFGCLVELFSTEFSEKIKKIHAHFTKISWFWVVVLILSGVLSWALLGKYGSLGAGIIAMIIGVSYLDDVAANLIGASWDPEKRKKLPGFFGEICPTKSVQGTVAGFIAGGIAAFSIILLAPPELDITLTQKILLSLGTPTAIFFGDFFESYWKRKMTVKDSGDILRERKARKKEQKDAIVEIEVFLKPHGGVFDRFDSVMLSLSFVSFVILLPHLSSSA